MIRTDWERIFRKTGELKMTVQCKTDELKMTVQCTINFNLVGIIFILSFVFWGPQLSGSYNTNVVGFTPQYAV